MAEAVDCVVIGAGVVGLACARALTRRGREVLVLERHLAIGTETSSRNSEVIHAGIYYPAGSNKARLCVAGKHALYTFCAEHGVGHRRCGKVIVAGSDGQRPRLEALAAQARANGVGDLRWLGRRELAELEPEVEGVAALLSPSTGIVDSHGFMLALQGELEAGGGVIAFATEVLGLAAEGGRVRLETAELTLSARWVINAAGLSAPALAALLDPAAPEGRYAVGHYYSYSGRSPFQRLVYPMPEDGGLGVHVTLDLAGQARFGPDVRWQPAPDYRFDDSRYGDFVNAIRSYYPGLDEARLQPGYTGVRPKISGPGEPAADFRIDGPECHRIAGLVNLLGIESPGLTSALAIAEDVGGIVEAC